MKVSQFKVNKNWWNKQVEFSAFFEFENRHDLDKRIWFKIDKKFAKQNEFPYSAFLCSAYVLSLHMGEDLEFVGNVDKKLLQNLTLVGSTLGYKNKVNVIGGKIVGEDLGKQVGLFFTLGLDSFHSWMNLKDQVNYLIYIDNYDVLTESRDKLFDIHHRIDEVAKYDELKAVFVDTNLRYDLSEKVMPWNLFHGVALSAAAYIINDIGNVYISSSDQYLNKKIFWGTGVQIDSLWSSSSTNFVSYAPKLNRIEKIKNIVSHKECLDIVLSNLRVCWQNTNKYNCLECEKCLRTCLEFRVIGYDKPIKIFSGINLDKISNLHLDESKVFVWKIIEDEIKRNGKKEFLKHFETIRKYY